MPYGKESRRLQSGVQRPFGKSPFTAGFLVVSY